MASILDGKGPAAAAAAAAAVAVTAITESVMVVVTAVVSVVGSRQWQQWRGCWLSRRWSRRRWHSGGSNVTGRGRYGVAGVGW